MGDCLLSAQCAVTFSKCGLVCRPGAQHVEIDEQRVLKWFHEQGNSAMGAVTHDESLRVDSRHNAIDLLAGDGSAAPEASTMARQIARANVLAGQARRD